MPALRTRATRGSCVSVRKVQAKERTIAKEERLRGIKRTLCCLSLVFMVRAALWGLVRNAMTMRDSGF
jgi:hypothetical protein